MKPWTRKGVLVRNWVERLFKVQLPSLSWLEKTSSQWMSSLSWEEQQENATYKLSIDFLEHSWNVCAEGGIGESRRKKVDIRSKRAQFLWQSCHKSVEAFTLLLFENYIDKWRSPPPVADEVEDSGAAGQQEGQRKKKAKPTQQEIYTRKKSGHSIYGGWSHEEMARFNVLYRLVQEVRACPQQRWLRRNYWHFVGVRQVEWMYVML